MSTLLAFFAALAVAGGLSALVAILVGSRRTDPVADAVTALPGVSGPGLLTSRTGWVASGRDFAPKGYLGFLEHRLNLAGRPAAWTIDKIFMAKPALAGAGLLLAVLWISNDPIPLRILLGSLLVVLCFFVPDLVLYSRGQERQATMQNALADTLDQMTISVEAGLGFEAAMSKAGTNGSGPLAEELIRTLQDMSIGRTRKDAYQALAERTDSADLRRFTRSVIQADTYGIAIADVLRVQAGEMRLRRRQRAEEQAMKVPVKVIFPLVFCILPVLFIVLLTPAVINIVKIFSP
jgi:tight adherence protein C